MLTLRRCVFSLQLQRKRHREFQIHLHLNRMGCGSSAVASQQSSEAWKLPQKKERSTLRPNSGRNQHDIEEAHYHTTTMVARETTEDIAKTTGNTRIVSASSTDSKISTHTNDSGVGDDYITERFTTEEQATTPEEVKTPTVNIDGNNSGHTSHPLTPKPMEVTSVKTDNIPNSPNFIRHSGCYGWAAFDVIMGERPEGSINRKRKPPGVRRLERRRGEIASKGKLLKQQRVAEQRRKELEKQMLDRIRARHEREQQIKQALEKFMAMQSQKTEEVSTQEAYSKGSQLPHSVEGAQIPKKLTPVKPPQPQRFSEETAVDLGAN